MDLIGNPASCCPERSAPDLLAQAAPRDKNAIEENA
jgi:hypothetical protein